MKNSVKCIISVSLVVLAPVTGWGCACGCGVFDVGTSSMFPHDAGGMAFIEYDFQNQNRNWSNTGPAPAANNGDKDIRTDFTTYGLQYLFNRSWGLQVEVPYDFRDFKTLGGATGNQVVSLKYASFGDVRLEGLYTGLSPDLSTALIAGIKLPTGDFTHEDAYNDIDRDSEIGTGSTDLLIGGFHRQHLFTGSSITWFVQGLLDVPVLTQDQYRPGIELDSAAGLYMRGWNFHQFRLTPVAQVIASVRTSDSGNFSSGGIYDDPSAGRASGYQRVLLSPGLELDFRHVSLYADVELPVFQDFVGNQLVAPFLFKFYASYLF